MLAFASPNQPVREERPLPTEPTEEPTTEELVTEASTPATEAPVEEPEAPAEAPEAPAEAPAAPASAGAGSGGAGGGKVL